MGDSRFGQYIRMKRIAADLTLRQVADRLGISHVFLGEVERGTRAPFKKERWNDLIAAVPGIDVRDLEEQAALTRPVQLHLGDAPHKYRELGLALARRIQKRDLPAGQLDELLRLLDGENE